MGISVQHLTKVYGAQKAIDDISFDIPTGEIVGFLGPNGAGKTTTMKIITCFMPPTSGTVKLGELNIHDDAIEIKKQIGYLPEHNPLYLELYVREYLRYTARLYKMFGRKATSRIDEIIGLTGLEREQHKKIRMLSKGYRQRVGLAQALLHDPKVLILDEPTSGLDPNQIIEIRNLIKEISKEKTIIFSTHILQEVEAIADRVIIIDRGKIIRDAPTNKLEITAEKKKENIVTVQFDDTAFDFSILKALEGVKDVVQTRKAGQYEIITAESLDIRTKLFEESLRQKNLIRGLKIQERSLEEVFRNLTKH